MVIERQEFVIGRKNNPSWITENHLENLLRKEVAGLQNILKIDIRCVNNCKENYMNVKVEIEVTDGKRRFMGFILKTSTLCGGDKILPYLYNKNLSNENIANFQIVPKFEVLYKAKAKTIQFAPTAYKFQQSVPEEYILYEDLHCKGFRPIQKDCSGLTTKQMEVVLEKLAAFHAASVVSSKFPNLNLNHKSAHKNLLMLRNRIFHEHLRGYNLQSYEDKIKSLQFHFLTQHSLSNHLEFTVLLLGNCCLDNMLFMFDAFGNIKDFVFINLDMCSYGNPVKDLLYLLLSSCRLEDKLDKFEYFICYYYDQLIASLQLLNYTGQIPKLTDFHGALITNNHWAFEAVAQVLPLVLWDPSNINPPNLAEDGQAIDKLLKVMYAQQNYCHQLQKLLPWLENKAFLEE